MSNKPCSICGAFFSSRGNFRYCSICRGKIERGELERNAPWITDAYRTRQRARYFRTLKRRNDRYAYVDARHATGDRICYWCKQAIPKHRLKHNSQQKFCSRACFGKDCGEQGMLTGHYYNLSKKGNTRQEEIWLETGVRPGTEKRRAHVLALAEARRHGKPWRKTGPKRR